MSFRETNAADIQSQLYKLFPPGPIWSRVVGGRFAAFLAGAAEELARVHNEIAGLVDEFDPSTTDDLLEDWERVAGLPEPCDPDPPTDKPTRRQLLVAKLRSVGGQTPSYYKAISDAATGEDCTINEFSGSLFTAGSTAGSPLYSSGWAFWWSVSIPNTDPTFFKAGDGAGGALAVYPSTVSSLGCMLDRIKPEHTRFFFDFPDDDPDT